jgi:hypothetical protein
VQFHGAVRDGMAIGDVEREGKHGKYEQRRVCFLQLCPQYHSVNTSIIPLTAIFSLGFGPVALK